MNGPAGLILPGQLTGQWPAYVNGVERATDTSGNVITGLDVLDFDISNTNEFYGNVKCVAVFKEALSDDELEKLTT